MTSAENPVVLMLHGFMGSPQNWRHCVAALSAHRQVFVPELPIFSELPPSERQEHVLRFLLELIHREEIRRVVVMGNSLGGQLALHLAQRDPERVCGLVLTGSGGLYKPKPIRVFYRRPNRDWLRGYIREIFFDEAMVTEDMVDELQAIFNNREKLIEVVRLAKNIRKVTVRQLLPQIHCPVLLVWGAEDKITPPSAAREFQKLLPDAELHFIPRCGHTPMLEQPGEFVRLAEDFLQRISARERHQDLMSRT